MALTNEEQMELASLEARTRSLMRDNDLLSSSDRASYDSLMGRADTLRRRSDEAPQGFTDSRVGPRNPPEGFPSDPALSVPSPVASFIPPPASNPEALIDPANTILRQAPTSPQYFLPLTGDPRHDNTIREIDAALVKVNDGLFGLNPADIHGYDDVQLGGVGGPSQFDSLRDVSDSVGEFSNRVNQELSGLRAMVGSSDSEDTWMARMRAAYKPMLDAAESGVAEGGSMSKAREALVDCGSGVNRNFDVFRSVIKSTREQIAGLYTPGMDGSYVLDPAKTLAMDPAPLQALAEAKPALVQAEVALMNSSTDWEIPTRGGVVSTTADQFGQPGPVLQLPDLTDGAPPTEGANTTFGGGLPEETPPEDDSNGNKNEQLYSAATPAPQPMSQIPQIPPIQFSPIQIPDPSAPFAPLIADAVQSTQLASDRADAEQASALKQAQLVSDQQRERSTADAGNAAVNSVMANSAPRPGDPVRAGALGADGLLLDKDGDGKMDEDAVASTRDNSGPLTTTLDVDGREVPVTVSDPRLAEIMTRMAEGSSNNPVRILDAMKDSGIAASDYGQKIDTMELRPGDVVTGSGKGIYLGEGLVLTEKGAIKNLPEVMDFRNPDQTPAAYRIELPDLPGSSSPDSTEQPLTRAPESVMEQAEKPLPAESGATTVVDSGIPESPRSTYQAPPVPAATLPSPEPVSPPPAPAAVIPEPAKEPVPSTPEAAPLSSGAAEENLPTEVPYQGKALG